MAAKKTATKVAKAPGKITKVNPATKLTQLQIDTLCYLHSTGRQHTMEDIKEATKATASPAALKQMLNKLAENSLVTYVEHNDKWSYFGKRVTALGQFMEALRTLGGTHGAGDLGAIVWGAKGQKDAPKRFFAAGSAALSGAFQIGAVYRMVQDGKTVAYGAVA